MRKIPTLFERDWDGDRSRVLDIVMTGCEWVLQGYGTATRKYDGTCCLVRESRLYKRHEVRPGKTAPPGFEPVDVDDSDKTIGWVPVGVGPEDRWHREAIRPYVEIAGPGLPDGTYELVGPKIQGNPEGYIEHVLIRHADADPLLAPRDFEGLADYLADAGIEGIVWHHGALMAKIKACDFGHRRVRPNENATAVGR